MNGNELDPINWIKVAVVAGRVLLATAGALIAVKVGRELQAFSPNIPDDLICCFGLPLLLTGFFLPEISRMLYRKLFGLQDNQSNIQ